MTIYLTGGTGLLGGHFIRQAIVAGHSVMALRRPSARSRVALPTEPMWLDGDLETAPLLVDAHTVLVHLAAHGVDLRGTWADCLRWNVQATMGLLDRAWSQGIRQFVICGSCFEYGRCGEMYESIPASSSLDPVGPYAASKAAASLAALAWALERPATLMLLRPFHVFGEGEAEHRFWPSLRRAALAGENFPMTPGEQIRDFVPAEEVAAAFLAAATRLGERPAMVEIRNVGTGQPQTLLAFASAWWKHWQAPGRLQPSALAYRDGEVMRYVPDLRPHVLR